MRERLVPSFCMLVAEQDRAEQACTCTAATANPRPAASAASLEACLGGQLPEAAVADSKKKSVRRQNVSLGA